MREFKIVRTNEKGKLVNDYEFFRDMEAAVAWADKENKKREGSVIDIELMDCNEELKYEYE